LCRYGKPPKRKEKEGKVFFVRELNRLLGRLVFVLATASALILAAPIAAAIELLAKG
jgi:hypothetical protein